MTEQVEQGPSRPISRKKRREVGAEAYVHASAPKPVTISSDEPDEDTQIGSELSGLFLDMLVQCINSLQEQVEEPQQHSSEDPQIDITKSWLTKARLLKAKLEDGVSKRERDEVVQEIRTVLGYTAKTSSGTADNGHKLPAFGKQMPQAPRSDNIPMDELSVGADFDMEASLRMGQELSPVELWSKEPNQIFSLGGMQIQQVVCGASHTIALTNDGNVQAWGWLSEVGVNLTPQKVLHIGERVTKIAAGLYHTVLLTESCRVLTYGLNDYGQLGQDNIDCLNIPQEVPALEQSQIRWIACGIFHTAVVDTDGLCFTWGMGSYGQLGHGDFASCAEPRVVPRLGAVEEVACGLYHTLAVLRNGDTASWGWGEY